MLAWHQEVGDAVYMCACVRVWLYVPFSVGEIECSE